MNLIWGEIAKFLKVVKKLIAVMKLTWCDSKYTASTDENGEQINLKMAKANETAKCDPAALRKSLKGSLFAVYQHMVLAVERLPTKLASWGEACP